MQKKIIVKQVDTSDCGVCCLLSIIRHYQGNVPLELLKIDTNTTKLGTNAYEIIKAAEKYGFEGKGIKCELINDLKLPVIAHLNINNEYYHFIVIYKIKENYFIVMDPAVGKIKLNKEKFYTMFTGNVISLIPTTEIAYLKPNPTLKNIIKLFFKNNKLEIIKILFIELFLMIIIIINSFNLKLINNNLNLFTIIFLSCLLFQIILSIKKNKKLSILKNVFKLNLTKNFFSHILLLPLNFIQLKSSGEILTRIKEINLISDFIINIIFKNIIEILICVFVYVIIFLYNVKVGIILLFFIIIYIFINYLFYKYINPIINEEITNNSDYNSKLNEYINNLETIKILNTYSYFYNKFNLKLKEKIVHTIKLEKILLNENVIKDFVSSFALLALIFYTTYLKINILTIITILNLTNIFFDTLKSLLNDIPFYNYQKNIFIKLSEFFSIKEEKLLNEQTNFVPNIKLLNVSYSFNKIKTLNYNFYIKEKTFVMIKGKNGSGKSTICKLLTKTLKNYQGTILIGDKNIKDYKDFEIRNLISYSNQSAQIFKDTIKNNIILGKNISNDKFNLICKICELESLVQEKSNRYESIIQEKGSNFSGGEIQRIILARTLLTDKKIIILDETLSAVNIRNEIKIINNMKKYLKDKTIIYITHKSLEKYFDDCIELERND